MAKLYKCPFCDRKYIKEEAVYTHMDSLHHEDLCGLTPKHLYFNYKNRYELTRGNGKSIVSGKPTQFNEVTGRYERILPEEKEQYRQMFLNNLKKVGKENIMKDMNHQKEMLAHRSISGKYRWSDGSTEFTYTGTYEKKFLIYLDTVLGWPSSDIMAPAPQLFPYIGIDGKEHAHIPDFYITSLNLIVNIKSASNKHYRLRDIEIERLQDESIKKTVYNYIKVYDNQFSKFFDGVQKIKASLENNSKTKVIVENDSWLCDGEVFLEELEDDDNLNLLLESIEN